MCVGVLARGLCVKLSKCDYCVDAFLDVSRCLYWCLDILLLDLWLCLFAGMSRWAFACFGSGQFGCVHVTRKAFLVFDISV